MIYYNKYRKISSHYRLLGGGVLGGETLNNGTSRSGKMSPAHLCGGNLKKVAARRKNLLKLLDADSRPLFCHPERSGGAQLIENIRFFAAITMINRGQMKF
jgi:hypothetical protein